MISFANHFTKPQTKSIRTTIAKVRCIDYYKMIQFMPAPGGIAFHCVSMTNGDVKSQGPRNESSINSFISWSKKSLSSSSSSSTFGISNMDKNSLSIYECVTYSSSDCQKYHALHRSRKNTFEKFSGQTIKMLLENYQKRICCIMRPVHSTHIMCCRRFSLPSFSGTFPLVFFV